MNQPDRFVFREIGFAKVRAAEADGGYLLARCAKLAIQHLTFHRSGMGNAWNAGSSLSRVGPGDEIYAGTRVRGLEGERRRSGEHCRKTCCAGNEFTSFH